MHFLICFKVLAVEQVEDEMQIVTKAEFEKMEKKLGNEENKTSVQNINNHTSLFY